MIRSVEWSDGVVVMLDQRLLPGQEVYHRYQKSAEVAEAIRQMVIRGAPAIGIAAAMGLCLSIQNVESGSDLDRAFEEAAAALRKTRPTARNLFWAIERMSRRFRLVRGRPPSEIRPALAEEALVIQKEDIQANRRMGFYGQALLPQEGSVLTHCNTGALATGGYGTALGIIRAAVEQGKKVHVFADETRPFLQGARLTAWEMWKENIPCTLITDSMSGQLMRTRRVRAVLVGADRVAANGDVANKIGTYTLAVLARQHDVPFYVAAPLSTIDLQTESGDEIPIEYRDPREVTRVGNQVIAPEEIAAENPAFDITPNDLVSALVTEAGVVRPPYEETIAGMCKEVTRA